KPLTAAEWRSLDPDQQTEFYACACERFKVLPSTRAFDGLAVIRLDCLGERRNFGGLQPTRDPTVWSLKLTH
ncbi:MAG TPA: hypothetical protein VGO47_07585, partial [Chlamydiales bacterium]|nr:hypothetical protein [Chlamydiales bacterium]